MEHFACNPNPDCPYYRTAQGCMETIHHRYFPASEYQGVLAKTFRNLDENKELICRRLHDVTHIYDSPPEVPSRDEMFEAVDKAVKLGELVLSQTKYRKIYGDERA